MVQSWRLKKEGVVPGEGEGEALTVGNMSVPDAIPCAGGVQTRDTLPTQGRLSVTKKTLMNRLVMNDKQHNTTTIPDQIMTKPFNVVNTKPALCFMIWEPPPLLTKASLVTKRSS